MSTPDMWEAKYVPNSSSETTVEEKEGMSIILHCMTVGDESVKKIAQLLMQILFTGNENLSKGRDRVIVCKTQLCI